MCSWSVPQNPVLLRGFLEFSWASYWGWLQLALRYGPSPDSVFSKSAACFAADNFIINVDQPTVVRQIRALQRIETVSYTMDKIISGERENPILPSFLAGDRLLLVVHGEVIAGLDLSKLQSSDVEVHGRSVSIHLPSAEIFTTSLDNAKTRVYSRDTGLFSTPDPNLEGEVREEAERQLRAAALQDGILKTAETNARQTVASVLSSLGFENVEIR